MLLLMGTKCGPNMKQCSCGGAGPARPAAWVGPTSWCRISRAIIRPSSLGLQGPWGDKQLGLAGHKHKRSGGLSWQPTAAVGPGGCCRHPTCTKLNSRHLLNTPSLERLLADSRGQPSLSHRLTPAACT